MSWMPRALMVANQEGRCAASARLLKKPSRRSTPSRGEYFGNRERVMLLIQEARDNATVVLS